MAILMVLQRSAREGFSIGSDSEWETLIDISPKVVVPARNGFLEAATADTYLAIRADSLGIEST